jgi:glycosyltransferase involved in cell wall biosynthesis
MQKNNEEQPAFKKTISIITVVYNSAKTIESTICNVIEQKADDVEYIVIDGNSQDGTVDIIRKYAASIDYWKSEPDKGVYDAWNKGLAAASGHIVGILNSGDRYEQGTFDLIRNTRIFDDKNTISYGITKFIDENGITVFYNRKPFRPERICTNFGFMHTTCFAPRTVYDRVGKFDASYRIGGDTEWLLRAYCIGVRFVPLGNCTHMVIGGMSETGKLKGLLEYRKSLTNLGFSRIKIEIGFWENIIKNTIAGILRKCRLYTGR